MPGILLGDVLPNFEAETTIGKIKFHEFLGNSWGILFSHPRDFTPVCTTELARAAKLHDEFKKRDVKMIALSIDSVEDHRKWSEDIMSFNQDKTCCPVPFPIIADDKRELSVLLGMLDPDERDKDGMPLTARCVTIMVSQYYECGKKFICIHFSSPPFLFKPGQEVMVIPSLSDEEANKLFPAGFTLKEVPSGKKYIRYTKP
uniref:Peroxiredoxin 6 n=1 Tax=Cyprinus carpio TaxID=7962 RepID=A0A8C2I6X6_CYPCA